MRRGGPPADVSEAAARLGLLLVLVAAAAPLLGACAPQAETPGRIVLRGGEIADGSGAPLFRGDVLVEGDTIVAVGDVRPPEDAEIVDVTGLVVAPGFIDAHSHADLIALAPDRPELLAAKLRQGVTTIIVGNCGLGPAPSDGRAAEILGAVNAWMTPHGVSPGPLDIAGYLAQLEARGTELNVGTLVPHGPLRITTMGLAAGNATPEALATMRHELDAAFDAGALGVSFGLIYPPGMYADTGEIVALAEVAARRGRPVTLHVRGSSETLLDATRELIEIAERSGARVHHSHLEAVGERFWDDVAAVIDLEDAARARGLRITHDMFPYTRAATMMAAIFPPWALEGGLDRLVERLRDPGTRSRIRQEIESRRPEWPPWEPGGWPHNLVGAVGWDGIVVASVPEESGEQALVGQSLEALGAAGNRDPFDVLADLMITTGGRVGQQVLEISGDDRGRGPLLDILRHPSAIIVSDAEDYARGTPHPAHAGAFALALRLAREGLGPPLPETIHKMTGAPAALFGLDARGRIEPGAAADLVVFDPREISDRASWTAPRQSATGVRDVLIGGSWRIREGAVVPTASRGAVLRARSILP